jgi:LPS sulfotransferase NodH
MSREEQVEHLKSERRSLVKSRDKAEYYLSKIEKEIEDLRTSYNRWNQTHETSTLRLHEISILLEHYGVEDVAVNDYRLVD